MRRTAAASLVSTCALALLAGCGGGGEEPAATTQQDTAAAAGASGDGGGSDELTATLKDPSGAEVGTVTFSEADEGTEVSVEVKGLQPGFHAFHVHAIGVCEPGSASPTDPTMTGDFLSAGGHLGAGEASHGEHEGDLPSLYVSASGTGSLDAVMGGLDFADLTDQDGSAAMVHAGKDNFANIPERYAPNGPDDMTKATGDAGGRVACGVVGG